MLPHGRELVVNGWTTLRFVVTCSEPLGIPELACGKCTMTPQSFQIDAACYRPPKPQ